MKYIWATAACLSVILSCTKSQEGTGAGQDEEQEKPEAGQDMEAATISARAGTFNIRCLSSSDTGYKSWNFRKDNCIAIITDNDFDIIGLQEVSPDEGTYLKANMSSSYGFHLTGRDDGESAGEAVGVLYKADRFNAIAKGRFFLSPTPESASSPYPGWTSSNPGRNRIAAWAILQDKESGKKFMFISTHLEVGKTDELMIRRKSAELICSYLGTINPDDLPVILAGDMNSKPTEETNTIFRNSFADCYFEAEKNGVREGWMGSFNGHNYNPENYLDTQGLRIDYIYAKGNIEVCRYRVVDDKYDGYYPSDHCPVLVDLNISYN